MENKKQYRVDFVREFGNLFPKYGTPHYEGLGIESMELVEDHGDYVVVHYTSGSETKINVAGDSLGAIVLDVMKQIL